MKVQLKVANYVFRLDTISAWKRNQLHGFIHLEIPWQISGGSDVCPVKEGWTNGREFFKVLSESSTMELAPRPLGKMTTISAILYAAQKCLRQE